MQRISFNDRHVEKAHITAALLAVVKYMRGIEASEKVHGISVADTVHVLTGDFPVTVRFSMDITPIGEPTA